MKFDTLPQTCLVDEALAIRVVALRPGERITLKLWSCFGDAVLSSSAAFIADSNRVVDLGGQAPVAGAYRGVDAMGLFWSRAPVQGDVAKGHAGVSKDPFTSTLTAEREEEGGTEIISCPIRRVYLAPGVTSIDLRENGFPHRVEHLKYANAGHGIGWPNGPTTMSKSRHPVSGEVMDMGGTAEGTAHARQDSWPRMLAFLRHALAVPEGSP